MKVKFSVEYEVEPDHELNAKEQSNVVGMLQRLTRNRVLANVGRRVGGEGAATGWEVDIKSITIDPVSKV